MPVHRLHAPGTHVIITSEKGLDVPAVTNYLWLNEFTNLVQAGDDVGIKQMQKRGQIVGIPSNQEGLVIDKHKAVFSTAPDAVYYEVRVKDAEVYVRDMLTTRAEIEERVRQGQG